MAHGLFGKYDFIGIVIILLVIIGGIFLFMNIRPQPQPQSGLETAPQPQEDDETSPTPNRYYPYPNRYYPYPFGYYPIRRVVYQCPLSVISRSNGRFCSVMRPQQSVTIDRCTSTSLYFNNERFNIVQSNNKRLVAQSAYKRLEITDVSPSQSNLQIQVVTNNIHLGVFKNC